jgi:hypothetical protein
MDACRLLLLLGLLAAVAPLASAQLSPEFYKDSCPDAEKIVAAVIEKKLKEDPGTAAGLLRLIFHDCFANVPTHFHCICFHYENDSIFIGDGNVNWWCPCMA